MKQRIVAQIHLWILLFFPTIVVFSQSQNASSLVTSTSGVVSGAVVDINDQPLEYSIIYVLQYHDSMIVANGISDNQGKFVIASVPFGKFMLKIESMGFRSTFSSPFTLSKDNSTAKFSKIKVTQKIETLNVVEVRTEKEMLQSNLDKKVYNVGANITAEGTTALEILEEIPSVDVDIDGNVMLRGSENVTILIDGRPTNLTLDQIPSSQIESIEVITNPSARLEPDGMAGILNVVLKKEREHGFNGMVSIGGALSFMKNNPYFDKYNASVNLNYRFHKVNLFLNYNFRNWGFHSMGDLERLSWFKNSDTLQLIQDNRNDGSGQGHNLQTGIDWFINAQNTLSFSFGFNAYQRNSLSEIYSENNKIKNDSILLYSRFSQPSERKNLGNNFSGTIFYKKTFLTKGRELTADLLYSQRNNIGQSFDEQYFEFPASLPAFLQQTTTIGGNRIGSAQLDFVTPIGNGGRIETGYKFSYRNTGQDYQLYTGNVKDSLIEDLTKSNNFDYSEYINASYFIYSNSFWEKLKVQAGLRAELANTISDLKSADSIYKNNYFNLFPTLHVKYDFNAIHSMQISYSRRVSRPRHWHLNPFLDYSDRQNLRQGNPYLKPEFVNSVELGYLMTYKKSSINVTLFYRQRDNIIARYTEMLNDTTTLTTYENINKGQNVGLELSYGQRFWDFWRLSFTGSIYYENIESNNLLDKSLSQNLTGRFRISNSFSLPQNWDFQVTFGYFSPSLTTGSMGWGGGTGQGKRQSRYSLSAGIKKSFLKKNLVLSLNAQNIVYRQKNVIKTYSFVNDDTGYDAISNRYRDGLQFNLTLSYKFNHYKKRVEKDRNGMDEYPEMMDD